MNLNLSQIASNLTTVDINGITVWFSYETAVAVSIPGAGTTVHENIWSQTTAKHLTRIDGGSKEAKAARVDSDTFGGIIKSAIFSAAVTA